MTESDIFPGYTRSPESTERLIAALRAALYAHPEQRLGQLLVNLVPSTWSETDVGHEVFATYDEKWIDLLTAQSPDD